MAEHVKTYTIKGTIRTDRVGSECNFSFDIDAEEWEDMTPEEQDEAAREIAFSYVGWDYDAVEKEAANG